MAWRLQDSGQKLYVYIPFKECSLECIRAQTEFQPECKDSTRKSKGSAFCWANEAHAQEHFFQHRSFLQYYTD